MDALAFGLSTLVMSRSDFDHPRTPKHESNDTNQGNGSYKKALPNQAWTLGKRGRRKGNDYAQYIRKFSIGNGSPDMVGEYLIHKEGGKMLGTLAALAIGKMQNLETFIWDMPTGIVQDVWEALASLSEGSNMNPRLQSVWVRFHDSKVTRRHSNYSPVNSQNQSMSNVAPSTLQHTGALGHPSFTSHAPFSTTLPRSNIDLLKQSYPQIEHPNFSILPALKGITALEIDEVAYIEELSVLIERSLGRLSELRLGIAALHSGPHPLVELGSAPGMIDVLQMLFSKFIDTRERSHDGYRAPGNQRLEENPHSNNEVGPSSSSSLTSTSHWPRLPKPGYDSSTESPNTSSITSRQCLVESRGVHGFKYDTDQTVDSVSAKASLNHITKDDGDSSNYTPIHFSQTPGGKMRKRRLNLSVLEFDHVTLNPRVLLKAIDWKHLTSLTLLYCPKDDDLWRLLRKVFPPPQRTNGFLPGSKIRADDYSLKIRRLHTTSVSPSLLNFLKENLAPNSLESLFLQIYTGHDAVPTVSVDKIYQSALRHHRASLKKLTINSEDKPSDPTHSWRLWTVTGKALQFITSGKIPNLRELCLVLDSRDFHAFLQSLPNLRHLRSLYIPHIKGLTYTRNAASKNRELALQVLDVVALRPELELCYVGIGEKCFEIMEGSAKDDRFARVDSNEWSSHPAEDSESDTDGEDDDEDGLEDDWAPSDASSGDDDNDNGNADAQSDTLDEDMSDGSMSDCDSHPKKQFKLREILFYSERVEVFKVRNATL